MIILFQLTLGWVYSHIFEYISHKYVLHNHKLFYKAFKNHFSTHHKIARKNNMYDRSYENIFSSKFEVFSLVLIAIIHFPLLFFIPYFVLMTYLNLTTYYFVHRKSHIDIEWGKKWLPWHYAHHMNTDQNLNWGVRSPIIDKILGTSKY